MENQTFAKRPGSIDEAIEMLDRAIPETERVVESAVRGFSENFQNVAQSFGTSSDIALQQLSKYSEQGMAQAREAAKAIDGKVRENPWPFIAGAAVGMFALGYIVANARRD